MNKIIFFSLLIALSHSQISAQSSNTTPKKLDSIVGYSWYQNNFVKSNIQNFIYSPGAKLIEHSNYEYDINTKSVRSGRKYNYSYDPLGNQIKTVQYELDTSNNVFETKYQSEYIYNSQNNRVQSTYYNWNQNNSQWYARGKDSTYFDANNNNIFRISFLVDQVTGQWRASDKEESSYNTNNDLTLYQYWTYDIDSLQWFQIENSSYMYDTNGNVLQFIRESAFQVGDTLTPYYKETYSYDSASNQNEVTRMFWNTTKNQWRITGKEVTFFNFLQDPDSLINYSWISNSWLNSTKNINQFNDLISGNSLLLPSVIENDYAYIRTNKQLTKNYYYSWDKNRDVWEELGFADLYYSDFITSVSEIAKNKIGVYPNPAANIITFSIPFSAMPASLTVMDIHGRAILAKSIVYNSSIDLTEFQRGLYIYKIEINGEYFVGKFIKL